MRIVHVEAGRHLYGGGRQVLDLLRGLRRHGVASALVCAAGGELALAARDVAEVHALPWRGEADVLAAWRLRALVRRLAPELVHAHGRRGADAFAVLAAGGRPTVITRRVDNPEHGPWVRWKYRRCDAVVAVSQAVAGALLGPDTGLSADAVTVIPDAVDTQRLRPGASRAALTQRFAVDPDAPVVAMLAQFIPRKGHAVLLDALPAVFARHPRLQLVLVGRGPLQGEVERRVREAGWADRVHLAGFRDDVADWLGAVDLLVHPALAEGMGVVTLEAGACGVPVVAAAAGGIPEVVVDGLTGRLVPAGEAAGLADAISDLLDDPALAARMGQAARGRIVQRFSVEAMTDAYLAVYRSVLPAERAA